MNYTEEIIGPKEAQHYLSKNVINRTPNNNLINKYSDAMKRGEWQLNGQPIILSSDGALIDGQHRLMAIVKSNTLQRMVVCRGISSDAHPTIDTGRNRTSGDVLSMYGVSNAISISAIVKQKILIENGLLAVGGGCGCNITNPLVVDEYNNHSFIYQKCFGIADKYYRHMHLIQRSVIGGMIAHLFINFKLDNNKVLNFFNALYQYDIYEDCKIINELRRMLINQTDAKKMTPRAITNALFFAWNCYATGNTERTFRKVDLTQKVILINPKN